MTRPEDPTSGFALLETVVMLVLGTFVLKLLAFTVGMVSRSSNAAARLANEIEGLDTCLSAVRRDLASATPTTVAGGQDAAVLFEGSAHSIGLVSSTHGPAEMVWIGQNGDGRMSTLTRAASPLLPGPSDFTAARAAQSRPLLTGPWQFRFAFASVKENVISWTETWNGQKQLPDLIRLQVVSTRQPEASPLTMTVSPRVRKTRRCAFDQPESCTAAQPVEPPQ